MAERKDQTTTVRLPIPIVNKAKKKMVGRFETIKEYVTTLIEQDQGATSSGKAGQGKDPWKALSDEEMKRILSMGRSVSKEDAERFRKIRQRWQRDYQSSQSKTTEREGENE